MEKIPKFETESAAAFDPAAELERIKTLPRTEKRAALEEFKEKLFEQKEEIADLERKIIGTFFKNPDAGEEPLLEILEAERGGLSDLQKEMVRNIIRNVTERRNLVSELRERFSDDRELFRYLFGFLPSGPVRISLGPFNFRIEADSLADSAALTEDAFLEQRPPTPEELEIGTFVAGRAISTCIPEDLPRRIAVVINNSPEFKKEARKSRQAVTRESVLRHEEQHSMNMLFDAMRTEEYIHDLEPEQRMSPEELEEWLELSLRLVRGYTAEVQAEDEILAFLRDGAPLRLIRKALASEAYGPANFVKPIAGTLAQHAAEKHVEIPSATFARIFGQVFGNEFLRLEQNALEAVKMLLDTGIPRDKLILFLANEPFARWKKFAMRYLEQKRKRLSPDA